MSRRRYFVYRSIQTVFLLWMIITFLFFFFRLMPGDFIDMMLYEGIPPETAQELVRKWGLDQPLHIQYINYIANLLTLDAGFSLGARAPVWDYVQMRIFNTFILVAPAITLGYIVGAIIGTILGSKRGTRIERFGIVGTVVMGTLPIFFLGIVMIVIFSSWLDWFPSSGMLSPINAGAFEGLPWWKPYTSGDFAIHYILPFTVIVLRYINTPALVMRTSVVEVLGQDFIHYQRITGLPKLNRYRHLAKHASLPALTLYPIAMTRALSGLVLLEVVFNWPGIGQALVQAVLGRDFAVVQFIFLLLAVFILLGNWAIDLLYSYIDPRVTVEAAD
ncbi:ABC transporter permease [Halorarius litoreus]|uniref:ABC transporter permease n=1 Tax=Halorarius litoreus TaxID=2962676 RepID=UPI0020CBB2F6|nr:ABC transporter permease [Halorarius litoreus]